MAKVYLEFEEDSIPLLEFDPGQPSDETFSDESNEEFDDSGETDEDFDAEMEVNSASCIYFHPMYLYRNEFPESIELEVDFDTADCTLLHLVVTRFSQNDIDPPMSGKWKIIGVYKTRREAKQVAESIELGTYNGDTPWTDDNSELELVDVISLPIEN